MAKKQKARPLKTDSKTTNSISQKLSSYLFFKVHINLSCGVASGSEITQCGRIGNPLVVYRFTEKVMTSIVALRSWRQE